MEFIGSACLHARMRRRPRRADAWTASAPACGPLLLLLQAAQPGIGVAGRFNVTLHWEGQQKGGETTVTAPVYQYDASGQAYMFQLHAVVRSVTPAVGSTAGGTRLTISGAGFPEGRLEDVSVHVGGVTCDVVGSTFAAITCVTRAAPAAQDVALASAIRGMFPGSRGVEYAVYHM